MSGERFGPNVRVAEPLRYELDPEVAGDIPWLLKAGGPLMHIDLIEAIRTAGVDNIDVYDAVIVDPEDGAEWRDWKAVNIVGVVAAADLQKSKFPSGQDPVISMQFDELVINPVEARGLLMFRLAESLSTILVHAKVKDAVEARGIEPIGFIKPEDWA